MNMDQAVDLFLLDCANRCVASTVGHYKKLLTTFKITFAGVDVLAITAERQPERSS